MVVSGRLWAFKFQRPLVRCQNLTHTLPPTLRSKSLFWCPLWQPLSSAPSPVQVNHSHSLKSASGGIVKGLSVSHKPFTLLPPFPIPVHLPCHFSTVFLILLLSLPLCLHASPDIACFLSLCSFTALPHSCACSPLPPCLLSSLSLLTPPPSL